MLQSGVDLGSAQTEHQIRNVILSAFGEATLSLPEPWKFEVVYEFANGGDVMWFDSENREQSNLTLNQEVARRSFPWTGSSAADGKKTVSSFTRPHLSVAKCEGHRPPATVAFPRF